jgi:hypothetical protein
MVVVLVVVVELDRRIASSGSWDNIVIHGGDGGRLRHPGRGRRAEGAKASE